MESVRAVLCEASSTCRFERDASAAQSPASVRPVFAVEGEGFNIYNEYSVCPSI